jgi:hypothetical protein
MVVKPNADVRTALEKHVRRCLLAVPDLHEGEAVFGDRDRSTAYFVDATQMANFVGENADGRPERPPPTGPELARRQRFH